jgi:hypothetical protein
MKLVLDTGWGQRGLPMLVQMCMRLPGICLFIVELIMIEDTRHLHGKQSIIIFKRRSKTAGFYKTRPFAKKMNLN